MDAGPTWKYAELKVFQNEKGFFTHFVPLFLSPAQLEQNAQNRSPGIHPIIIWQQEEEEKAKVAAASAPVDVKAMMSKIDRKK